MTTNRSLVDSLDLETGRELVARARHAVEQTPRSDDEPTLSLDPPTGDLAGVRGAFVTIKRGERLRGCIGRPRPEQPLGEVVVEAAVDAAGNDPRCRPVQPGELGEVTITVTVLSAPEPLTADDPAEYPDCAEIGRHGLTVQRGRNRGLLLPQVAVDRDWDAESFLTAACQKARLPGTAWRTGEVEVRRFIARAFTESEPRGEVVERPLGASGDGDDDTPGDGDTADTRGDQEGDVIADGGTVREPAVAGDFYAGSADALENQLRECFEHDLGPGPFEDDTTDSGDRPLTVVAPHAGYPYSGPVAAHSYAALAGGDRPETVVVLGPDHRRVGDPVAVAPQDRWRTPLGEVPIDRKLADALCDVSDDATVDPLAHEGEHSIEVQLPFLQWVLGEVSILPICLGGIGRERAESLGEAVTEAIDRTGRDAAVVSSTDLTHYQPHEGAVTADEPVLAAIEALDTAEIERQVEQRAHSMCGPWGTVAGLVAARERDAAGADVLQYATSADTAGQPSRVVGYCAAAIR